MGHVPRVGYVDGGHIKARSIEALPLAQLLHDLHHDSLTVGFVASLIGLGQVKSYPLGMLLTQGLDDIKRPFAERLSTETLNAIFDNSLIRTYLVMERTRTCSGFLFSKVRQEEIQTSVMQWYFFLFFASGSRIISNF